jgi:hypothetical protein
MRNVSCVKDLGKTENFVMDAQVVELGQKLNVVGGNIRTVICVACV